MHNLNMNILKEDPLLDGNDFPLVLTSPNSAESTSDDSNTKADANDAFHLRPRPSTEFLDKMNDPMAFDVADIENDAAFEVFEALTMKDDFSSPTTNFTPPGGHQDCPSTPKPRQVTPPSLRAFGSPPMLNLRPRSIAATPPRLNLRPRPSSRPIPLQDSFNIDREAAAVTATPTFPLLGHFNTSARTTGFVPFQRR